MYYCSRGQCNFAFMPNIRWQTAVCKHQPVVSFEPLLRSNKGMPKPPNLPHIQMISFSCLAATVLYCPAYAEFASMQTYLIHEKQYKRVTVHDTCSSLQEAIYSLTNMCVFLFFPRHQATDVLFLQCQFAPSLSFWLPSNGPRDLIGQGYAFGHLDCDSPLANESGLFAH